MSLFSWRRRRRGSSLRVRGKTLRARHSVQVHETQAVGLPWRPVRVRVRVRVMVRVRVTDLGDLGELCARSG